MPAALQLFVSFDICNQIHITLNVCFMRRVVRLIQEFPLLGQFNNMRLVFLLYLEGAVIHGDQNYLWE